MREYQEASTAVPMSLPPATPSPGLKSRVLAAATGQAPPRPATLTRIFWSAAAVLLFAFMALNLFNPPDYEGTLPGKGPQDSAPSAEGRLLWKNNRVKIEISGLPALPAGKEYQLWQIGPEKQPIPQRTFRLGSRGDLAGTDWMKYAVAKGQTFALTVEPAGGSRTPTMPLFFVATVN